MLNCVKINKKFILSLFNISCFLFALFFKNITLMYLICLFEVFINIFLASSKWKKNIVYIFFNICLFIFCLSKPMASFFLGKKYWQAFEIESSIFTLSMLFVSLEAFSLSISLSGIRFRIKDSASDFSSLQKYSFVVFLISSFALIYEIKGMILFYLSHSYLSFYTGEYSREYIPTIIKVIIQLQVPSMCIFLATRPRRKQGYLVLFIYLISQIHILITGRRAAIMLAALFCIVYCLLRDGDTQQNLIKSNIQLYERKWLSNKKILVLLILAPFGIMMLTLMNEFRNGVYNEATISSKISHPISFFLYEQGSTIDLLENFYYLKDVIDKKFYFFGSFYDTFFHNSLISSLLGIPVYSGNTVEYLKSTHTIAAQLSYHLLGDSFFLGNSVDSCYLIDLYYDFGWIGLFVISFLLGRYMVAIPRLLNSIVFIRIVTIYSLLGIFFLPRGMFMSQFSYIVSPYFWISLGIIIIPIMYMKKNRS